MVDAFRAYEYHFPPAEHVGDLDSRIKDFVANVIDEIKPDESTDDLSGGLSACGCELVLIGKYVQKTGKDAGKAKSTVERCSICRARGNRLDNGRAQELRTVVKHIPKCTSVPAIEDHHAFNYMWMR